MEKAPGKGFCRLSLGKIKERDRYLVALENFLVPKKVVNGFFKVSFGKAVSLLLWTLVITSFASTVGALAQGPNEMEVAEREEHLAEQSSPIDDDAQSTNDSKKVKTLQWEAVTTLIIRNNDILDELDLYGLEQLRTLVIKTNSELTTLKISSLPQLRDITIENNDKLQNLGNIELSKLSKRNFIQKLYNKIIDTWKDLLFAEDLTIMIKYNDCLGDLSQANLSNLQKLRIEGNNSLKILNLQKSKENPPGSGAGPPQ